MFGVLWQAHALATEIVRLDPDYMEDEDPNTMSDTKSTENESPAATIALSTAQQNELAAEQLQAELSGDDVKAATLQKQLDASYAAQHQPDKSDRLQQPAPVNISLVPSEIDKSQIENYRSQLPENSRPIEFSDRAGIVGYIAFSEHSLGLGQKYTPPPFTGNNTANVYVPRPFTNTSIIAKYFNPAQFTHYCNILPNCQLPLPVLDDLDLINYPRFTSVQRGTTSMYARQNTSTYSRIPTQLQFASRPVYNPRQGRSTPKIQYSSQITAAFHAPPMITNGANRRRRYRQETASLDEYNFHHDHQFYRRSYSHDSNRQPNSYHRYPDNYFETDFSAHQQVRAQSNYSSSNHQRTGGYLRAGASPTFSKQVRSQPFQPPGRNVNLQRQPLLSSMSTDAHLRSSQRMHKHPEQTFSPTNDKQNIDQFYRHHGQLQPSITTLPLPSKDNANQSAIDLHTLQQPTKSTYRPTHFPGVRK